MSFILGMILGGFLVWLRYDERDMAERERLIDKALDSLSAKRGAP